MREFFMEAQLEAGRLSARLNAGESGAQARTVQELIESVPGWQIEDAVQEILTISLADSPNHGREDLRKHIARLHPGSSPSQTLVTTGTSEALFLLFEVLQPRKVAVLLPGFQLLYELANRFGAEVVPLPIRWDDQQNVRVDPEELLDIIRTSKPDLVLFNHPHNPSGWVPPPGFLDELISLCEKTSTWLVGDEHYRFLAQTSSEDHQQDPQPTPYPLASTVFRPRPKIVTTGSFIKCLGAPGLRIGWCVGPEPLIAAMQSFKNYTTHTVNPISEWLAERLLRDPSLSPFHSVRNEWLQNLETLRAWQAGETSWRASLPEGGLVTCLSVAPTEVTRLQVRFADLAHTITQTGLFLLDLRSMEFPQFAPDSHLGTWGGFRMNTGLNPAAFRDLVSCLDTLL